MLLGSTEWAEAHDKELQQHAVLYINSDGNGRGYLQVQGSHTLQHFINGVAAAAQDPETEMPASERLRLAAIAQGQTVKIARSCVNVRMSASSLWDPGPITLHSWTTLALPRSILLTAAKTTGAFTIRSMMISTGLRIFQTRILFMPVHCRKRSVRL